MTENDVWETLTLDGALNCVEEAIQTPLSNLCTPRNSYINRVFEMEVANTQERLIAKFYRPHRWTPEMILEEHALLQHLRTLDLSVIPPLTFHNKTLFMFGEIPFALFPKKWGRPLDELNEDLWQEMGRLLGRLHLASKSMNVTQRPIWSPAKATQTHLETLLKTKVIPPDYENVVQQSVTRFIQDFETRFTPSSFQLIHGDCHFGNIIHRPEEGLLLVDFDDIVIGPVIQDVWMLLPDHPEKCQLELDWFKEGYNTFSSFPDHELTLIPALQVMRQIHFAAWCAIQVNEPQFKHHFPEWGSPSYWNLLVKDVQSL